MRLCGLCGRCLSGCLRGGGCGLLGCRCFCRSSVFTGGTHFRESGFAEEGIILQLFIDIHDLRDAASGFFGPGLGLGNRLIFVLFLAHRLAFEDGIGNLGNQAA